MKRSVSLVFALTVTLSGVAPVASAETIDVPIQDTTISTHPNLGGPDSLNGDLPTLYAILGSGGVWLSFPVVQFDLSDYSGAEVLGAGTLELFVMGNKDFVQYTRPVSVHEVLVPWDGDTATYNNFGAEPGVQFGTDVGSGYLDLQYVAYPAPGDRYVQWTIPQSVIQGWIDDPSSNHGVLLRNRMYPNQLDLFFDSMEGPHPPRLAFEIDSDGDGLGDDYELAIAAGSGCPSPLDPDSDDDGIWDGAEVGAATDPCAADTDGDGTDDSLDACPVSDLADTVTVNGTDTGVINTLGTDGCSLADLVGDVLGSGESAADVARRLTEMVRSGVLTGSQLGAILRALNSP